jgi:hypothetical protein
VQVTVSAVDSVTGTPVAGTVFVDDVAIGPTNTIVTTEFSLRSNREFDPVQKRWIVTGQPPVVTVRATGYPQADVEFS